MGYEGLVDICDEFRNSPDLETISLQREPFIQRLTDDFISSYKERFNVDILVIDDVAKKLSQLYFELCYKSVKPTIEDKANRYKMASLMELIIVQNQVLIHPEEGELRRRQINAEFGMAAAFSMLKCMISNTGNEFYFMTCNAYVDGQVNKLINDHKLWLATKQLNELPIFINAQFYELIEVLLGAPYQIHG